MRKYVEASVRVMIVPLFICSFSTHAADRAPASGRASPDLASRPLSKGDWRPPVVGRLANGVRFAILQRQGNDPGVGLLMRNEGGFIAERRPGERGLAHLIEHIAFHSPTVGSPDDLDHLKRIGLPLTVPAPNAGSTSWRETNYYLSTKTTTRGDLDMLMTLFRDVAVGMTLRTDAVDISRGEVIREMADKTPGNAIYADYIGAVAPGSPNDVIDAQNSDDVPTATIETLRALYHRLYRPENIMIVVVGNVSADEVRTLIERRFGHWRPTTAALRPVPYPGFRRDRIRPISVSSNPQGRRTALVTVVMPTPVPSSARDRQARGDIMDMLITRAITDRLAALQPIGLRGNVGMFIENGEQGHRQIMLWDNFTAGQWKPAVAGLRKTTCDVTTAGFTTQEWATAKRNVVVDLERRVADMPMVANVDVAKDLSHALADGRHLLSPDELLRYARTMLPRMGERSASRWWRQQWGRGAEHFRVEAPELAQLADPVSAIRATANKAATDPACKVT